MLSMMMPGAAVHARDFAGHYYLDNGLEMASELLLKPDGCFEFMLSYGAADYWAKGDWHFVDGSVMLSSERSFPKPPFRLARTTNKPIEGVRIFVVAPNGRRVPNIDVVLQHAGGASEIRTDADGVACFEDSQRPIAVSFGIWLYRFQSGPVALNPNHNEFSFVINAEQITELRFDDERLTVDEDMLVMHYWGDDHPLLYARQ
jgi:hypothetical protein